MDVQKELIAIAEAKVGSKEMALFFDPEYHPSWRLDVGNPSKYVMLGEVEGQLRAEGDSLEFVISDMKRQLGI